MSSAENKKIVQQFINGFNQKDLDSAVAVVAPDVRVTGVPGLSGGRDAFRLFGEAYLAAFPDAESAIDGMIAEDDWVATWGTFSGTQRGEMMGIPATGQRVRFEYVHLSKIAEGKIVEQHIRQDDLGMLQQLGLIPSMAPTA